MKKLDVFILKSFLGPFILATSVANFILLIQYLLKYFDDFVGKNLGILVFAKIIFYFSLNMLQMALPLGVLLASLMTFGNLGENFELTAIKSAGISLLRVLRPLFIFIIFLSIGSFYFNNYIIPMVNLKAYSLLYDIKQTKPALDIKEGSFYGGLPKFSIKVGKKLPDGQTLKDVIIYDHSSGAKNLSLILADSCRMYTILNDRYLKLELYNGNYYLEQHQRNQKVPRMYSTQYYRMEMVFNLASFDLKRKKEELFQNNRQMKNISQLTADIDSFQQTILTSKKRFIHNSSRFYDFHLDNKHINLYPPFKKDTIQPNKKKITKATFWNLNAFQKTSDQIPKADKQKQKQNFFCQYFYEPAYLSQDQANSIKIFDFTQPINPITVTNRKSRKHFVKPLFSFNKIKLDTFSLAHLDSMTAPFSGQFMKQAISKSKNLKSHILNAHTTVDKVMKELNLYIIEINKKYAQALACLVMFILGAPLGAIIKKGGLGLPTIIAIFFFIIYYVCSNIGIRAAKEGAMNPYFAVWLADLVLLPFGLFFLRQAKVDARLLETDFYLNWLEKLKIKYRKVKNYN